MRPNIDFLECLKDSPRFRASLEEVEGDLDLLEVRLEKLVKLCGNMIEAGKAFNNANSAFIGGLHDVALHFKEENVLSNALSKFSHVLSELQKYHNMLLDQANRTICKNVHSFIKNEMRKVKDTRKHFEKISDELDGTLVRNASVTRSKPAEGREIHDVLIAARTGFTHVSLDYVFQIYVLHAKKRFDILDTMLAFMHAQSTYFHQGSDLFEDLEQYKKHVAAQLEVLNAKAAIEQREMEKKHALVQQKVQEQASSSTSPSIDLIPELTSKTPEKLPKKEGYLFKRTSHAFKSWVRRWFTIENHQLVYRKRSRDSVTVMEDDLRLCTVKLILDSERRFCFEVVSPTRSHILQADSEELCQSWVLAIQKGVSTAYHRGSIDSTPHQAASPEPSSDAVSTSSSETETQNKTGPQSKSPSIMETITSLPGNETCADCGSPDPRWSSVNLGVTLCIQCSGIHRSFGVHMSKVKSLNLDSWEPEVIKVMAHLGNTLVKKVYEYNVQENLVPRATPQCTREVREGWIRAKYIQRAFVRPLAECSDVSGGSVQAARKWSVMKPRRRSPAKESKLAPVEEGDPQHDAAPDDVLVFGSQPIDPSLSVLGVDDSDDTDTESDLTSCEDLGRLKPDLLLYRAAEARNLPVMMEALALQANPNWQNPDDRGRTPLMNSVLSGSLAPTELLLLSNAKVDTKDLHGQTALHHAVQQASTGHVCQFLKRNANQHAVDENGQDALALAISLANADIVTLLRLSKLNEEMKDTDMYCSTDETFNEVFRDFTNMANHAPEKLNRHK